MKKSIFMPLTATPFRRTKEYREIPPQNPALAGYIRCFWGSDAPFAKKDSQAFSTMVIPDACADIIYSIDHTKRTILGRFCGVSDVSFVSRENPPPGHVVSTFGIRFYAWTACAFSEDSLKGAQDGSCDVSSKFQWLDRLLRPLLLEKHSLRERARIAEELLLTQSGQMRQNHVIRDAADAILLRRGALTAADLARECFISGRQLERLFHEYIGVTPKKLCNLVRYQYLWNEILTNPQFDVLDAVCRYGYADQSHLMREFKRYHAMNIQSAKEYARAHVGNIQSFSEGFMIK